MERNIVKCVWLMSLIWNCGQLTNLAGRVGFYVSHLIASINASKVNTPTTYKKYCQLISAVINWPPPKQRKKLPKKCIFIDMNQISVPQNRLWLFSGLIKSHIRFFSMPFGISEPKYLKSQMSLGGVYVNEAFA